MIKKVTRSPHEAGDAPRRPTIKLCLYLAGKAPNSQLALANLTSICEEFMSGRFQLEIVDVLATPMRALADGILVTPSLTRSYPMPPVRIVGNLSDRTSVVQSLGIS